MLVPSSGRRRRSAAIVAAVATCSAALLVHSCLPAGAEPEASHTPDRRAEQLDDAGYVTVAEHLQRRLDSLWSTRLQRYNPGPGAAVTEVNGDLLLVHSVAARRGEHGATRNDARARAIVRLLTGPAIWGERPPLGADPQVTGPGWRDAPGRAGRHPVYDTEAIDGLVHAYLARDALDLDTRSVARIRYEIHRVATSRDYRWPALRLNQINWYCEILAADAVVNGERAVLADGMGRHLGRFLAGVQGRGAKAGNLGAGLRFHYLPHKGPRAISNIDSAEYANIVLSFSRYYGLARDAGMRPPAQLGLLRDWVRRVISGYWTHSGYMNWDSGLGFNRWHQRKKVGLAQLALIGVAAQPELQPGPEWGAWAKSMLDRGLLAYDGLVERGRRIPEAVAYGVNQVPESRSCAYLAAARMEANAMRALEAGLGHARTTRPPALYSYDPDTGRLAVTTPTYNTAIVAVDQHAFPYGGLDLARLYDGRQEVAASIGGVGATAFGLVARAHGRDLLRTQYGDRAFVAGVTPLRLTKAPRGVGATSQRRAFAGPFTDLRVHGSVAARGLRATSAYRFTPGWIEGRWTLRSPTAVDAAVTFPSWGGGARVLATLRDGRTVPVGQAPLALARVRSLHVLSERSGYRVLPRGGVSVRLVATRPQPSAPNPGPTLEVALGHSRRSAFAARITVDA